MVWRTVLQVLRALWHRLCGFRALQRVDKTERTERQQLLSTETPGSAPVSPEPAPPAPVLPCTLIVMRHGHRQDEEDPFWHQTAPRPWDPPLSAKGKTQAAEAAGKLAGLTVDYVISSPFKRCLQTSAGIVRNLPGLPQGHWLVDWQLAEVHEPRVLFGMRNDVRGLANDSDPEAWMWGGKRTETALERFAREDCRVQALPMQPVLRPTTKPVYPEDLEEGLARYSSALQEIAHSFAGHTVLVVTHGECVRQAVLMGEPSSEVFEVKHTGYVVLKHAPHQQQQLSPSTTGVVLGRNTSSSGRHVWRLTSGCGETGVLWIEDDDD